MATYTIDTAEAIKHLKQNGFEEQQAEAIVNTFARTQDDLVSKQDLDLAIERLRKDLSDQMSSQFKWIIGTIIGVAGLLLAAIAMFVGGAG